MATICVDLDGTLTLGDHSLIHYLQMKPDYEAIRKVDAHVEKEKVKLIVYTARPWLEYFKLKKHFKRWGLNYHKLICGKFPSDEYIDNNSKRIDEL